MFFFFFFLILFVFGSCVTTVLVLSFVYLFDSYLSPSPSCAHCPRVFLLWFPFPPFPLHLAGVGGLV